MKKKINKNKEYIKKQNAVVIFFIVLLLIIFLFREYNGITCHPTIIKPTKI